MAATFQHGRTCSSLVRCSLLWKSVYGSAHGFLANSQHRLAEGLDWNSRRFLPDNMRRRAFSFSSKLRVPAAAMSIPKTMKAARVVEFGKPLEFAEVPVPTPGDRQVLVKMTVSGVCHSDVHMRRGDLSVKPQLPIVPGHEGPIPEKVKDEEAAPINCAGVTPYKALKVSNARPGQWVILIGAGGGLGFYALQYAKAMGFRIIAVDHGKEKIDYLQSQGFTSMDTSEGCIRDQVMKVTGGGAQVVMNLVPSGEISANALGLLRKRGTLVNVGLMPDKMSIDASIHVMMMTSIVGSLVGTRADLKEALEFLALGTVRSNPSVHDFSSLNELFDDLEQGKIKGRAVVRIP